MSELDYPHTESSEVSAREVMQLLRRRRGTVLGTFALFLALAALLTPLMTPIYRGTATMLVEDASQHPDRSDDDPVGSLLAVTEPLSLDTQVEVLRSGPLWQKVLARLGPLPPRASPTLTVAERSKTQIIEVTADSTDPRVARDAPNFLVDEYIRQTEADRGASLRRTREFVARKLAEAQAQLTRADARLRAFKEQYHLADLIEDRDDAIKAAGAAGDELRAKANELSTLQGEVREVQSEIQGEQRVVRGGYTDIPNPAVADLTTKIQGLHLQRITLLRTLKPTEPEVRELDAQIAQLQQALKRQLPTVRSSVTWQANPQRAALRGQLDGLRTQARGLAPEVARLRQQYQQAQDRLRAFPAWETRLAELQRDRDQAQDSQKELSGRLRDLRIREQALAVSARPLTLAILPRSPVRPQPILNFLVAAALGLVCGTGAACLRDLADDRIYTTADAEQAAGLRVLGRVPVFPRRAPRLIAAGADCPIKESFRRLRAGIYFAGSVEPVRTLMITSAAAGEGKTTSAANLAVAVALQGRSVILVDADLRKPSLHPLFQVDAQPGLTEVLAGEVAVTSALRATPIPGLRLLPAGAESLDAAERLAGPRVGELLRQLAALADLVILDTPPCLAVSDAEVLGSQVDAAVLVVGRGGTHREAVRMARELLDQAHVRLLGMVLNRMKPGDEGYYYRYRRRYGSVPRPLRSGAAPPLPGVLEAASREGADDVMM